MVSVPIPKKSGSLFCTFFRSAIHSVFLLGLLLPLALSSQNLIENPSFETFENCPERLGNFDADVVSWSTPTEGSTDYFNACSTAMGTPKNFNGEQAAEFGKGYAGLYLYAPDDYREYLQAELTEALEKGKEYRISFYVSLAERSDFAVKEFGVLFAKDKLEIPTKKELSKRHWYQQKANSYNYREIGYTNFYSDTKDWIEVGTRFTAKGTERIMIIGNFKNNLRTRKFETKRNAQQGAYYYVDRVAVTLVESGKGIQKEKPGASSEAATTNAMAFTDIESRPGIKPTPQSKARPDAHSIPSTGNGNFALNKTHIFENVLFDFDHFEILETGKFELKRIYDYLVAHPKLRITIDGHTDSVGTETYNQMLSAKRAGAVAAYLLELGIAENRISWQGYGGEKPISANTTEEGRKRNRRVEFVIGSPARDK